MASTRGRSASQATALAAGKDDRAIPGRPDPSAESRAGWDPRSRNSPDLGESRLETDAVVVPPGEIAGESEIVGEALGTASLAKDLGQGPGFHGLPRVAVGFQAGHLAQALDGLLIASRPGQAEPRLNQASASSGSSSVRRPNAAAASSISAKLALAQLLVPAMPLRLTGRLAEAIDLAGGRRQIGRVFQRLKRLPRGGGIGVEPQGCCQVPQAASGRCDMRWFQPSWIRASDASCSVVEAMSRLPQIPVRVPGA